VSGSTPAHLTLYKFPYSAVISMTSQSLFKIEVVNAELEAIREDILTFRRHLLEVRILFLETRRSSYGRQ
jgi:hypothetical protein